MGNADAVVAGRNFIVYSKPHDASNDLPDDTVLYGQEWSGWENRGYTTGGLAFSMGMERGEIRVDQEFDPVATPITGRTVQLTTTLAELTPANLQLASGLGTLDTVEPEPGQRGHVDLIIDNTLADQYNSFGYDIAKPSGEAFRVIIYKGLATGSPNPSVTPDNAAGIALEVTALVDTSTSPARIARVRDVLPALSQP